MIVKDVFSDILLGLAVLIELASAVGLLIMRDTYAKLHFVTPVALLGPALVALAVMVQNGVYENTGASFLALFFMIIAGPFISHATIRAIRIRQKGDWRPQRDGQAPAEEKEQ